jgi:hypothetical protein
MAATDPLIYVDWWLCHICGDQIGNKIRRVKCTNKACLHVCCEQCRPNKSDIPGDFTRSRASSVSTLSEPGNGGNHGAQVKDGYPNTEYEQHYVALAAVWTGPKHDHGVTREMPTSRGYTEPVKAFARSEGNSSWERQVGHVNEGQNHVGDVELAEEESAGCKCVIL